MPWTKEKLSAWRKENRARVNEVKRAYYARTPEYRQRAKEATRRARFRKIYGITPEEFEVLLRLQGNHCALCETPDRATRRLCVDHDHLTGRVRGLLCVQCNSALGKLGDSAEGLERAIRYLRGDL